MFGGLRRRTGQARIDLQLKPGTTVSGMLRRLGEQYGEGFLDAVGGATGERSIAVVILNGRTLKLPQDLERQLVDGDEVHLIPPIAGG